MPTATVIPFPSLKVLTPPQAAAMLQISVKTLIKMATDGQIPCFRAGRLWRFPAAGLEKWLESFEQSYSQAA
jgi:excisionase family DNA binding protein